MRSKKKRKIFVSLGVLFLILVAMLIRYVDRTYDSVWLRLIRSGIYIGMISAWGVSLHRRILQNQTRRYLTAIAGLMVLWLTLRTVKYSVYHIDVERYLWYFYYLPMLLIPTLSISAAMSLGKPEDYCLPGWLKLLYIPALVLLGRCSSAGIPVPGGADVRPVIQLWRGILCGGRMGRDLFRPGTGADSL